MTKRILSFLTLTVAAVALQCPAIQYSIKVEPEIGAGRLLRISSIIDKEKPLDIKFVDAHITIANETSVSYLMQHETPNDLRLQSFTQRILDHRQLAALRENKLSFSFSYCVSTLTSPVTSSEEQNTKCCDSPVFDVNDNGLVFFSNNQEMKPTNKQTPSGSVVDTFDKACGSATPLCFCTLNYCEGRGWSDSIPRVCAYCEGWGRDASKGMAFCREARKNRQTTRREELLGTSLDNRCPYSVNDKYEVPEGEEEVKTLLDFYMRNMPNKAEEALRTQEYGDDFQGPPTKDVEEDEPQPNTQKQDSFLPQFGSFQPPSFGELPTITTRSFQLPTFAALPQVQTGVGNLPSFGNQLPPLG